MEMGLLLTPSLIMPVRSLAIASLVLMNMLPVKPSVMTTSTLFLR